MSADETGPRGSFRVIVNDEEQYSLWPDNKALPSGWRSCHQGTREECLAFVEKIWTDMRPLSLRQKMDRR